MSHNIFSFVDGALRNCDQKRLGFFNEGFWWSTHRIPSRTPKNNTLLEVFNLFQDLFRSSLALKRSINDGSISLPPTEILHLCTTALMSRSVFLCLRIEDQRLKKWLWATDDIENLSIPSSVNDLSALIASWSASTSSFTYIRSLETCLMGVTVLSIASQYFTTSTGSSIMVRTVIADRSLSTYDVRIQYSVVKRDSYQHHCRNSDSRGCSQCE